MGYCKIGLDLKFADAVISGDTIEGDCSLCYTASSGAIRGCFFMCWAEKFESGGLLKDVQLGD